MRAPTDYKTNFGLYKATVRALEELHSTERGWWLRNALWHAEHGLLDVTLREQLAGLMGSCSPATYDDLKETISLMVGEGRGRFIQNQNLRVMGEYLSNLDDLSLAN